MQPLKVRVLLILILCAPISVLGSESKLAMATLEQVPYGFETEDGHLRGVLFDIMNAIIATSGVNADNSILPPKRVLSGLIEGKYSCAVLADTTYVQRNYEVLEPTGFMLTAGVMPRAGITLDNYESLKDKAIAVPLGILFDDKFDNDSTLNKSRPPQYVNAIRMLMNDRVDAVAGAISSLRFIAKQEGMDSSKFGKPLVFSEFNVVLACNDDVQDIIKNKLNQAVIELREAGEIQNILDVYF